MTELAHRAPNQLAPSMQPMSIDEKIRYAQFLAEGSLLPRAYQRNPGNMLIAIEMGEAVGIRPMQAVWEVHIIEGKPASSAGLISGLVRRAGHKLRVKGDDKSATAEIIRLDDPEFTYSVTWDMGRARNAGLTNKDNWKKYPAAMLKARAITEVARDACEDALMGIQFTPEELGATVDQEGNLVESRGPARQQSQRFGLAGNFPAPAQQVQQAPKSEPVTVEAVEDHTEDTGPVGAEPGDAAVKSSKSTKPQWDLAAKLMRDMGISSPGEMGAEMRAWAKEEGITRELGSMKDLTSEEATGFVNYLETTAANTTTGELPAEDGQQSWQTTEAPE